MNVQTRRARSNGSREAAGLDDLSSTSVEQATAMIRQAILSGRYGPGERIKVADLSSQFGFSAMPLREALRKLEGEGLVEIEPNRGATVRRLDRRFVEDLYELNTELRIFAVRRGIKTMTLDKMDVLEGIAKSYEEAVSQGDFEEALRLNREFHGKIVEIGGNREALRMFQRGWELISAFRRRFGYGSGRQQGLAREKLMLIEALRRQDLELAEAIYRMQHAAALEDIIQRLDGSD
ncbi:GntR family transcriptional regulator [Agaricicola taiwanensis]|uniref:GntR family transcriptional regulator n=1 Tax=Agaricicola taiwanensis TaxID=591372 RepID=A0A8J2VVJ5_9RHOB|nr:GntR family transcriptional regulator [Agaricicola taiwanensis]GGE41281.1 GntR family transcriptional regulator [Agaricicola taiwanensis]